MLVFFVTCDKTYSGITAGQSLNDFFVVRNQSFVQTEGETVTIEQMISEINTNGDGWQPDNQGEKLGYLKQKKNREVMNYGSLP